MVVTDGQAATAANFVSVRRTHWAVVGLTLVLVGGACLFLTGCSQESTDNDMEIRNVLIFLVDTLRADHLGTYGYTRNTSPNIDAYAAESVQFERAFSVSPWTRSSVVSLFTSMYPVAHATQDKEDIAVDSLLMMAEVFRENGFRTGGFSSNVSISEEFNVVQGL